MHNVPAMYVPEAMITRMRLTLFTCACHHHKSCKSLPIPAVHQLHVMLAVFPVSTPRSCMRKKLGVETRNEASLHESDTSIEIVGLKI